MTLRELMGHSDLSTTMGYFKLSDQTLAQGYFSAMEILKSNG
jgi:site-specific recombinase XerC